MKKRLFLILFLLLIANEFAFCEFNDLEKDKTLKEIPKPIQDDPFKDMKLPKQDTSNLELPKPQFPQQPKIEATLPTLNMKNKLTGDSAVIKNQEMLKKFMEAQNKEKTKEAAGWAPWIPKEHRGTIELFTIALFIILTSIIVYRRKIKKAEAGKDVKQEKEERKFRKDLPLYRGE